MAFIRRSLRQFCLYGLYSDIDIFMDAYLRGVDHISDPNKPDIGNVYAWMRATSYNVIRELSRERRNRFCEFTEAIEQHQHRHWTMDKFAALQNCIEERIQRVVQAFASLSEKERRIIELRFIQQLPWSDVQQQLVQDHGELPSKIPALRQRGKRALNRLRNGFHKLEQPS
jgi:DNA-directed RNA polymerase specialized sigma24 family protein